MERYVDYAATKRGMSDALRAIIESSHDIYADTRGQLQDAFAALLTAGADAGLLRAGIDADDVFRATGSIFLLPQQDGWARAGHARAQAHLRWASLRRPVATPERRSSVAAQILA
jgi:hypothetical protein